MDKETKQKVISQFQRNERDTGSTEVQVAILTARIEQLTTHMANNRQDAHTKRSLLSLVGQRRRLLAYAKKDNPERYQEIISKLGLRK